MLLNFLYRIIKYSALGFSLLVIFQGTVHAQAKKLPYLYQEMLQKADEQYSILNYKEAVDLYLQVLDKAGEDTAIICKIANCYRLRNNSKDAEEWYRRAILNNENTIRDDVKLQFAQVLSMNYKYEEALYWYKSYYNAINSDERADAAIKTLENISSLFKDTAYYDVKPVSFNTIYSEFSPTWYKNGIIFLSDRNTQISGLFLRFFSAFDSDGNFTGPDKFVTGNKTDYNEGPVAFSDNYNSMVFSENYSPDKIDRRKINDIPLQMFYTQRDSNKNKWKDAQLLPFSNKSFSYAQPSLNSEGNVLYFSSNEPGGLGGNDLYMSKFENGSWGNPINLGNTINTKGDEMFPFIYQDSVLYFASNGHGGLGGLDIFKVNLKGESIIKNLGIPLNSANDDFGIIVDKGEFSGYFSSNRSNGVGSDDIYKYKVIRIPIILKILDENSANPVPFAQIYSVSDTAEEKIGVTNEDGTCELLIPVTDSLRVRVIRENYESKVHTLEYVKSFDKPMVVCRVRTAEEKIVLTDENNNLVDSSKNVVYKVQIRASRKPVPDKELKRKYKGDLQINSFFEDNWHKYSIGEYSTYAEARQSLRLSKVYDAFIIAYVDNKKVHITFAKAATNETNIKSPITRKDVFDL